MTKTQPERIKFSSLEAKSPRERRIEEAAALEREADLTVDRANRDQLRHEAAGLRRTKEELPAYSTASQQSA